MKKIKKTVTKIKLRQVVSYCLNLLVPLFLTAQIPTKERSIKIADDALYFNGAENKSSDASSDITTNPDTYDYFFGRTNVASGDCVTALDGFIFTTWYKGGKGNRFIQISRFNPNTGQTKTFQLNWKHTGFRGNPNIGESHNIIAVGISPKDKTMHLLYDMHAYTALTEDILRPNGTVRTRANPGYFVRGIPQSNRYFRYSYSIQDVTQISDEDWTESNVLVSANDGDGIGNYTHNNLNGQNNARQYEKLTYPRFFLNEDNDLFFQARVGGNNNGAVRFYKYNATGKSWSTFTEFNVLNASSSRRANAIANNWGLYGDIKFLNNRITIGFQRRNAVSTDKYMFQDGFYFARASNADGTQWETSEGTPVDSPVVDPSDLLVADPEDLLGEDSSDGVNQIIMSGPNDYTVTERGDIHMIARVRDDGTNRSIFAHSFKPNGRPWQHEELGFTGSTLHSAGNDVFIIGTNTARRIVIYKAEGGTNSFSVVYEETNSSDKQYRHQVSQVIDGKVYFYGTIFDRNNNTTKQDLYLDVIDLNIGDTSNVGNQDDLTGKWYRFKNVDTGKYLRVINGDPNATTIAASQNTGSDKQWRFIKSGDYYNIDSRSNAQGSGILRVLNSSIIGTSRRAPLSDRDKVWSVNRIFTGAYRFELRDTQKYIYNDTRDSGRRIIMSDKIGDRSKWILEEVGTAKENLEKANTVSNSTTSFDVFPNPTASSFSIVLRGIENAKVTILNILGKKVYSKELTKNTLELSKANGFQSGLYIIQVLEENSKTHTKKLLIK